MIQRREELVPHAFVISFKKEIQETATSSYNRHISTVLLLLLAISPS
jgi:hypothetical protein